MLGLSPRIEPALPYASGNWYPAVLDAVGALAAGANIPATVARLVPFRVRRRVTVTDLGCRITTASAGGNVRLGIYAAAPDTLNATGLPLGSVTVPTDAAGTVSAALPAAVTLYPGRLYWAAAQCDNATAVCQVQTAATAAGSAARGDPSLALASSGATAGFSLLSATVGYAAGMTDLTAEAQSPQSSSACALLWFKAA